MKNIAKRVFIIVLDSLGIGEAPDAMQFGDVGANTLRSISKSGSFSIKNLINLGLCEIDGVDYLGGCENPLGAVCRMREISMGKDTTIGHFELCGLISNQPLPTYPCGFPNEIIDRFSAEVDRAVLCNKPYSGTDVIRDFGDEHIKSGALIVYTSADSVFQIAAHEDIVPPSTLYEYCRVARSILTGKHAVGRVIARPFVGSSKDGFTRTANRRDFSLPPPQKTALDDISGAGLDVIGVGKIWDIFAGVGITDSLHTHSNREGMQAAIDLLDRDFCGLAFINLVDFDSKYGHRQDVDGYAAALSEFDTMLDRFIGKMSEDDVLIITADHGCDPADSHTDHTREYVPLIVYGDKILPVNLGTQSGFMLVGELAKALLGVAEPNDTVKKIIKKHH